MWMCDSGARLRRVHKSDMWFILFLKFLFVGRPLLQVCQRNIFSLGCAKFFQIQEKEAVTVLPISCGEESWINFWYADFVVKRPLGVNFQLVVSFGGGENCERGVKVIWRTIVASRVKGRFSSCQVLKGVVEVVFIIESTLRSSSFLGRGPTMQDLMGLSSQQSFQKLVLSPFPIKVFVQIEKSGRVCFMFLHV